MRFYLALFIAITLFSGSVRAQVSCPDVFPDGISAHSPTGSINLGYLAYILGGDGELQTPSVSQSPWWYWACSGYMCEASGSPSASSTPTFQSGNGANGNVYVGFLETRSIPSGHYGSVGVGNQGDLYFSSNNSVYYMNSLTLNYGADAYILPGDYWINGNFNIGSMGQLRQNGNGTVRIFVNGNVTIEGTNPTVGFESEELLIYATGGITLNAYVSLEGFLYANGNVFLGYYSTVTGAVSGASVNTNSEALVIYDDSELENLDFAPFCSSSPIPAPAPVALYHLDERSWTANSGDIEDSSGNGLNGSAVNLDGLPDTDDTSPAISSDPGTCGYGVFDGTADGYVEIPDPGNGSLLDFSDNFSVSAWIYPLAYGTSDLATIVSKDTNYEFHLNGAGQVYWWWGGGNEQITTAASVSLNAWSHIVITYQSGQQKVYINGAEAGAATSTAPLNQNNASLFIGTDLDFHSRRFNGYIDEVQIFDAALDSDQVNEVMNQTHTCPIALLNHYAVENSGAGVTCQSELITITAHDDTHTAVDADSYTVQVSATSLTPGWNVNDVAWSLDAGGGNGTFSVVSPGVAQYQFVNESAVALRLSNTSEALIDIDVIDGLGNTEPEGDANEDERLQFLDSGFLFYEDADSDGVGDGPVISSLISGGTSTNSIIRAVRTDDASGACIARVQGSQNVELAYECINPSNCQLDRDLSINGVAVEENSAGAIGDFQAVMLTFDALGSAPFQFAYYDVGKIRLHAKLDLPASGSESAFSLQGSSDSTTVYPADLLITGIQTQGLANNPGTTTAGAGFVVAGTPFRVTVEARNTNGRITPNFGLESPAETITLQANTLVMPAGGSLPALAAASSFSSTGNPGEFLNTSVAWPEVGTIILNATTDENYLDTLHVVGSNSGNVGRFFPESFRLNSASIIEGCPAGGFTYLSDTGFNYQPLTVSLAISAEAGAAVLTNYDQALGYPVGNFQVVAEDGNNGIDLSSRAVLSSSTFSAGVYQLTNGSGGLARLLNGGVEVPDGPLPFVQFGLQAIGGVDGVNFDSASLTMHAGQSNDCVAQTDCNAAAIASPVEFRFGRLAGANVHGPESASLYVPLDVQYWNGVEFVKNTDDHFCTTIALSDVRFNGSTIDVDANRSVSVGGGTSTGSFTNFQTASLFYFTNGESGLQFSAPGAGNTGSFNVDINLVNYPFLMGDWNGDGNYANDTLLPSMEISFGRYRGHDRIIHWREVLN